MDAFEKGAGDEALPTAVDVAEKQKNSIIRDGDGTKQAAVRQTTRRAIEPTMERRVVRKFDWHFVPLVTVLYLLSFLDRSNIGRYEDRPRLDRRPLRWLLTIFYIAYIVFEFLILGWKKFPPHIWATVVVFAWGLVATLQAATQSWGGEMALRFLLGMSEATSHAFEAAPLATCFAGALAYGVTSGHPGIANWRLLFLVEGLPTILMAPVAFFFLPDTPHQARFLTEDEKEIALARGVRQAGYEERVGGIVWKDIGLTLLDPKAWFTALMYFSCNVSFSSLPVFLPTILNEMGFTAIHAQGLRTTWVADRIEQRGLTIITMSVVGAIGYIVLATTTAVGPRYFATFLAAAGVFPCIANILPWVMNNQGTDTRRGTGMVLLNLTGQCGPLLGTRIYPSTEGPRYVKGHAICAGFFFFTTLLAAGLRTLLAWENKKLDRRYGSLEERRTTATGDDAVGEIDGGKEAEASVGVENCGPLYRYVL
ncbi:hypothetical protein LTR66_010631 [Elasticomyces elasticus]|nr:hypothetical protein LTR66_010631 [Elasticomyces elasticus]